MTDYSDTNRFLCSFGQMGICKLDQQFKIMDGCWLHGCQGLRYF